MYIKKVFGPLVLELWRVSLRLKRPYRWAKGVQAERELLIVSCSGEGGRGWGEVALPPHLQEGLDVTVRESLALLNEVAALDTQSSGAQQVAQDLLDFSGLHPRFRAGLAAAVLGWQASLSGLPLAEKLLELSGGLSDVHIPGQLPVNALLVSDSLDDLKSELADYLSSGFSVFKVKVSADRMLNMKRLALVRTLAPDSVVRIDANESWSSEWWMQHLSELSEFNLDYVEQPLPRADYGELVKGSFFSPIRIAFDESASDIDSIRQILSEAHRPVVILKPARLGGPDRVAESIEAIALEQMAGKDALVVVTNSLESGVGVRVAAECACLVGEPRPAFGLATSAFIEDDLLPAPPIKGGEMQFDCRVNTEYFSRELLKVLRDKWT